jgi:CRP-like cAMP-binding protein
MTTKLFQPGDLILKRGTDADYLVVITEGKAEVRIGGFTVATRTAPDLIGETALKSKEKRTADVVAVTVVKTIMLHQKQFYNASDEFLYMKKRQSEELFKRIEIIKNWEIQKILGFSENCTEIVYQPNQVIYK